MVFILLLLQVHLQNPAITIDLGALPSETQALVQMLTEVFYQKAIV
jgi:hypothetical protein